MKEKKRQTNVIMPGIRITLFFFIIFLLPLRSFSADSEPTTILPSREKEKKIIADIRQALNRIKPFKVDFVQQVLDESREMSDRPDTDDIDLEEKGEILFNHERQLKWTYLEPDYKVFLLEGDDYQFYDEDNEQLMKGKVNDRSQQWLWQLLFSDSLFQSRELSWDEVSRTLHIKRNSETDPGVIDVELDIVIDTAYLPVQVLQGDPSGARILYRFNRYQPKIALDDTSFVLKVPVGVDVIREEDQ